MKIRKATAKDFDEVVNLMMKADLRTKEWAEDRARRFIQDKKKIRYLLVAEDSNKLIGYVGIKKEEEDNKASEFINIKKYILITWIAVLPEWRSKKIGSKLLIAAEKYVKKFNKKDIFLDCRKNVLPFYFRNDYKIAGKYIDKGKMRYVLVKKI